MKRPFIKAGDPQIPYTDRKNLREEIEGPLPIETIVLIQNMAWRDGHSPYDIAKALQLTAERVYRVLDPEPAEQKRPKRAKVGYAEMKR